MDFAKNRSLGVFEVADHENRGYFDPRVHPDPKFSLFPTLYYSSKIHSKNRIFGFIFPYFVLGSVFWVLSCLVHEPRALRGARRTEYTVIVTIFG